MGRDNLAIKFMYWNIVFICTGVIITLTQFLYENKCIKSLTNECNVPISFIYWSDKKLIVKSIYWVALLVYALMKFWMPFLGQIFWFFINLIKNFCLPFHEYWINNIFCTKYQRIIEPLNYCRISFFPLNSTGFSIFMDLSK